MKLYRSNRIENLLEALVGVVAEPPPDEFAPECIVVPSRGMSVWLGLRLSERLGVWAGGHFPFPRRFVHQAFAAVLEHDADTLRGMESFTPASLVWTILAELPNHLDDPAFADPAKFYADDPRGTLRFGLCHRIADVFDQYLVFRPEMLLGWERGRDEHWQARLWRALVKRHGDRHIAGIAADFVANLSSPTTAVSQAAIARLPHRVSVFGVSALPPLYVRLLGEIGKHVPVHLFELAPSREHWADIRSPREAMRAPQSPTLDERFPALLASLGTVARDFQVLLEDSVDYDEPNPTLFVDPGESTLLSALQRDIWRMHRPQQARIIAPDDDSIELHSCHSPMREVEVLHDRILASLAADSTLQPRDVVVLMHDVERYAPLVEAVFERDVSDPTFIPYSISDRSLAGESPAFEALRRIAALARARLTSSEALDLLTVDPVAARFDVSPADLDTVTRWVEGAGIRWGIDGEHRRSHGQPAVEQNTWRLGLHRMLIGYALPSDGVNTFCGTLPYDEVEGQPAALLGRFVEFCERLFSAVQVFATPAPVLAWRDRFASLIDAMLATTDAFAADIARIRAAVSEVCDCANAVGFSDPVPVEAIFEMVQRCLEAGRHAHGFLAGGVTFCALLPMRAVPFRLVCVLGMSDGEFPRWQETIGFDLITRAPRLADRNSRDDDRYLFLETLLSARDKLNVFFVGQNIQDNTSRPPAVVVSELLDALADDFVVDDARSADSHGPRSVRDRLVVAHPMQPFSPRAFSGASDPRVRSFSSDWCEGAKALWREDRGEARTGFILQPLAPTAAAGSELQLRRLLQFYRLPVADLLKRRLGVYLDESYQLEGDREPLELDGLQEWRLGTHMMAQCMRGLDPLQSRALLRQTGELPLGAFGEFIHQTIWNQAQALADEVTARGGHEPSSAIDVDLDVAGFRLVGTLQGQHASCLLVHHYTKRSARHLLAAWIKHLVANVCAAAGEAVTTVLINRADKLPLARTTTFAPVDNAVERLADLVRMFFAGQNEPLLLFPRSSAAFVQRERETGDVHDAMLAARKEWAPNRAGTGEADNPNVARVFGALDPLTPGFSLFSRSMQAGDFPTVAVATFGPLFEFLQEP